MFVYELSGCGSESSCSQLDLSSKLSLTCGDNVNYYKSIHHPIPTRGNREHLGSFQNKSVSSSFNWVSSYILFLAKLKGRGRPFLEGARRGVTLWDYPQEYLVVIRDEKVSLFVKFEIILPLLCFLLDSFTNKHCRSWKLGSHRATVFWRQKLNYRHDLLLATIINFGR